MTTSHLSWTWDQMAERIDASGDCWIWIGRQNGHGYGRAVHLGRQRLAHRVVWEMLVGDVPIGHQLDHLCRVKTCVNPDHLEPATPQVNTLRAANAPATLNARKTHCNSGHPFDGKNLAITKDGFRQCRACSAAKSRRWRASLAMLALLWLFLLPLGVIAATECETFPLEYSVRPGPAQSIIGLPVEFGAWDLPDSWLGMPGTVHVETVNSPSVHWNNFLTLTTNGFTTDVYGPEDTANGVRLGDTNIDAIGPTLVGAYTIGIRDSRDVPGVEGASLEGTVTICATLPDVTTTTTVTVPSSSTTSTQPPGGSTSTSVSTPPTSATSTTAPTGSTTTTSPDETTTTGPGSSTSTTVPWSTTSTLPPITGSTIPFTGPEDMGGWAMAAGALILLGSALVLGLREVEK